MKWGRAALCALAFAPALWLGLLVDRYGVDVPYNDQWDELPLMQKALQGGLGVEDLWRPHNEHRIFFPRLVFAALARLTQWNVRAELAAIFLVALLIGWNLQVLLRRTWPEETAWPFLASFVVNLLVFSPIQHQNWLWGFQLQFLAPIACFTSVLALPGRWRSRPWAAAAGALAVVSSYSLGSGFLTWIAVLPLRVLRESREHRVRAAITWGLALAACLGLYLYGYTAPQHRFERPPVLAEPALYLTAFLGMLGQPLALAFRKAWLAMALGMGAALLCAYALLALGLVRRLVDGRGPALAWACLGLQALLTAGLIALGRAGAGTGTVFASRYTTPTLYLVVSVFVLAVLFAEGTPGPRRARVRALVCLPLLVWSLPAGRLGRDDMEARYLLMKRAKAHLVLAPLFPQVDFREPLGEPAVPFRQKAARLETLGALRPAQRTDPRLDRVATVRPGSCGSIDEAYPERQSLRLLGGAWLPERPSVADAVILTYRKRRGAPVVFALAGPGRSRPDVAEALDCPGCIDAGWEARFWLPTTLLPVEVEAWAYDVERSAVCRLDGSYRVEP